MRTRICQAFTRPSLLNEVALLLAVACTNADKSGDKHHDARAPSATNDGNTDSGTMHQTNDGGTSPPSTDSVPADGKVDGGGSTAERPTGDADSSVPRRPTDNGERAWDYPAIPYPLDWPYDPFTVSSPPDPASWPEAASVDYYYVAPDDPNASDMAEGDEPTSEFGRFGYPERPRATFPSGGWIGDVFPPGTVIVLKGGQYGSDTFYAAYSPELHGTAEQPVWIVGDEDDPPEFTNTRLELYNSRYFFLEGLHWIGGNETNGALSLTRDREGATHHGVLRRLRFENMAWVAGGGAIVGITAGDAEVHDIVAYQNVFRNDGGGFDWGTVDNDHHGYKVDGRSDGNQAYRIWIIDNQALPGEEPDPVDGRFKSLSGNLVQVGDERETSGGAHHIYVAGCTQDRARQALAWTKRSSDVIFSSNDCTRVYALAGGNGQCFGSQYDARWHWSIANYASESTTGWMHTGDIESPGPYFVVGNVFVDMQGAETSGWRRNSGISLWNAFGEHHFANNTFANVDFGVWSGANRADDSSVLYVINNLIAEVRDDDPDAAALTIIDVSDVTIENNLLPVDVGARLGDVRYDSAEDLNQANGASGNVAGDIARDEAVTPGTDSAVVDRGTDSPPGGSFVEQFVARYQDDPHYPDDPRERISSVRGGGPRTQGTKIDIGAHER